MDKILQPAKLNLDVNLSADGGNGTRFTHWKTQMTHYIDSIKTTANTEELQYKVLINVISSEIFPHVSSCTKYKDAITILEGLFVKTKNANYARHCLTTRKQRDGESVEQFLIALDIVYLNNNLNSSMCVCVCVCVYVCGKCPRGYN